MKSIVLLSILKQKARQIKKEKSLSWHQSLDEASRQFGYSNYKNYQNLLETIRKQSDFLKKELLKKISLENEMSKKVNLAISFIQKPKIPFQDVLDIIKLFQHSEEDMQFVCEKLNLKDEIHSFLLKDFDKNEIEMYYDNYEAKDLSLNNLLYKTNGNKICVDGEYDLTIKFKFEVDESYKEYPHFQDRSLFGTFEIIIDQNKKLKIENSSIGRNNEFNGFAEEELEEYCKRFPNELKEFPPAFSGEFEITDEVLEE